MNILFTPKLLKITILATLLLLLGGLYTIKAQVTIGAGTSDQNYTPINRNANYSASELLYTGAEVGTTGNITTVGFYKASGSNTTTLNNISIYMKASTTSALSSTSSTTGYTLVYAGTFPNTASGWQSVTLTSAFPYTSTSNNLHVLVVNTAGSSIASGYAYYRYTSTTFNTNCSRYYGSTAWVSGSTGMTQTFFRPNIQLTFAAAVPCAGAPTAGNATSTATTVCPNTNFTLSLTGAGSEGGLSYQWQNSSDNTNWGDIGGATAASYQTSQTATTYYRCNVKCTNSNQTTASGSVQVIIETNPLACICKPTYSTACTNYYISKVTFGTINTTTTCSGALNTNTTQYTTPNPTFNMGSTYALTVNTGGNKLGIQVWIDYNRNNTFEASEAVYGSYANANPASYTTNITIPNTATAGATGMRVAAKYLSAPGTSDACASLSSGETEDYVVTIAPAANCSTVTLPTSVNTTASKTSVCISESVAFDLASAMPAASGITYQWKSSADNVTYTNAGSAAATSAANFMVNENAKWFKCEILCNNAAVLTSTAVKVDVNVEVTSVAPAARCGQGSVTLQATGATGNTLNWYATSGSTTALYTGASYATPSISSSTTYYVGAMGANNNYHAGPADPSISTSANRGSTNVGGYEVFNVTQELSLDYVTVYPTAIYAGAPYTLIVELQNSSNTVLQTRSFTITAAEANSSNTVIGTPKRIYLGFTIPVGTGYKLVQNSSLASSATILRNLSGATAYYNVNNNGITFTNNYIGSTSYWYCFYDWEFSVGCGESPRKAVTATISSPPTGVTAANDGTTTGTAINFTSTPNGAASYSWSGPNGFTSAIQNPAIASAATSDNGVYTVTVTNSDNCTATANTTVAVVPTDYTWTGAVSTDWHIPGNWNINLVPNLTTANVVIPSNVSSNRYPNVTALASIGNLQIGENDSIVLLTPLQVHGNVSVTGTALVKVTGAGKFLLKGNNGQTVSGHLQFNTLNISNTSPAGVTVNAGAQLEIFNALELQAGNLNVTAGAITFRSTSETAIGVIDNYSAGYNGTLTGSINAERYYKAPSANSYSSHYISSPVDAPPVAALGASGTAGYIINNTCDETRSASNSPYGNVFAYNEAQGIDCGLEGWEVLTAASPNTTNAQGYAVAKSGSGILTLSGNANLQPAYTVGNITNTGWSNTTMQTRALHSGWFLAGNPYLSALNLQSLPNTGMDAQVQLWNTQTGSYDDYVIGADPVIPIAPFQAFMVHKSASGGSAGYTVHGGNRTRNISPVFYQLGNAEILSVVAKNVTSGLTDKTRVAFDSSTTSNFDPQADANKMYGSLQNHTLYTTNHGKMMARNYLKSIAQTSTVPLCMYAGSNSTYEFTFDGLQSFDPTSYIYLEDLVTGARINVRQQPVYTFTMAAGDNAERFVLHFTPAAIINATGATCTGEGAIEVSQPGFAVWNYSLTNSAGAVISTGVINETTPLNIACTKGLYTLTLTDSNGYSVARMMDVTGPDSAQSAFTISAIAVEQNEPVVVSATAPGAVAYLWNFGNGISSTDSVYSITYTTPGSYTVTLQTTNSFGCTATASKVVTVEEKQVTGIIGTANTGIKIHAYSNIVEVNFNGTTIEEGTTITLYNILGQTLLNQPVNGATKYLLQAPVSTDSYVLVKVQSKTRQVVKKVFLSAGN